MVYKTVDSPHGKLVMSGVPIRVCPNLDILGVRFDNKHTFEAHVVLMARIGILNK